MKYCPFCGSPVPVSGAKFCPECGKPFAAPLSESAPIEVEYQELSPSPEEPSPAPVPSPAPAPAPAHRASPRPSRSHGSFAVRGVLARRVPVLAACAAVLLLVGGFAFVTVQKNHAPQRAAQGFVQAVAAQDGAWLLQNVQPQEGLRLTTAAQAAELAGQWAQLMDPQAMETHLLATQSGAPGSAEYSCFSLVLSRDSLFSRSYKVSVSPVKVQVLCDIQDMVLYSGQDPLSYTPNDKGLLAQLFPGKSTLRGVYEQYGQSLDLGSGAISTLSQEDPQTLVMGEDVPRAWLELAGTETDLQVLIGGKKTDLRPTGSCVVLHPAIPGMEVTLHCNEYTQSFILGKGSDLRYTVDLVSQMEAAHPGSTVPQELPNHRLADQAGARFAQFYFSYLEAINVWNSKLIQNVSTDYRDALVTKMETYNKDLLFQPFGVTVDRDSLSRFQREGQLCVTFDVIADFNFAYRSAPDSWLKGGNGQTVTMGYEEAKKEWVVLDSAITDREVFYGSTFTVPAPVKKS